MTRNLSLPCTDQDLLDTYKKDTIKRKPFLHRFVSLLNRLDESTIIALDGSWGSGKTFFVNQAKNILDATNIHFEDKKIPHPKFRKDYQTIWNEAHPQNENKEDKADKEVEEGDDGTPQKQPTVAHVCVYYDAWKHDADDDPLLSLIYDIYSTAKHEYSFLKLKKITDLLSDLVQFNVTLSAQCSISISPFKIFKKPTTGDEMFDSLKKARELENKIKEFLEALLPEKGDRLVIFIDELDRCTPTFAVQLLEKIKHYFNDQRITFVISVDAVELQAVIKHHYGNEFRAAQYLDRFFDLRIGLPPIDVEAYLGNFSFSKGQCPIIHAVAEEYGFQMREITRYVRLLKIALPTNYYRLGCTSINQTGAFCYGFLVPIMIGLRLHDACQYQDFVTGNNPKPLQLLNRPEYAELMKPLFSGEQDTSDNGFEAQINDVYHALFSKTKSQEKKVQIGKVIIDKFAITHIQEIGCLLSDISNYDTDE